MMELLQRVFRASGKAIDYETQKTLAASRQPDDRRRLAQSTSARPEVLYYLAADADRAVRQAVAGNEATPVQADLLLARDRELAVRVDLAQMRFHQFHRRERALAHQRSHQAKG